MGVNSYSYPTASRLRFEPAGPSAPESSTLTTRLPSHPILGLRPLCRLLSARYNSLSYRACSLRERASLLQAGASEAGLSFFRLVERVVYDSNASLCRSIRRRCELSASVQPAASLQSPYRTARYLNPSIHHPARKLVRFVVCMLLIRIRSATVTQFRSISMPVDVYRHLVGKTPRNVCHSDSA